MTAKGFVQLLDYNYWAHRKVWACIQNLTDEQFIQNLNYSLGSIRNQVVHTMSYEWVWLMRLQKSPTAEMLPYEEFPTREIVRSHWDKIEQSLSRFVADLTDDRLDETVNYFAASGQPYKNTRREILTHLANHSTDHRAQTLAMLHILGVETVPQDYIYYLRDESRRSRSKPGS